MPTLEEYRQETHDSISLNRLDLCSALHDIYYTIASRLSACTVNRVIEEFSKNETYFSERFIFYLSEIDEEMKNVSSIALCISKATDDEFVNQIKQQIVPWSRKTYHWHEKIVGQLTRFFFSLKRCCGITSLSTHHGSFSEIESQKGTYISINNLIETLNIMRDKLDIAMVDESDTPDYTCPIKDRSLDHSCYFTNNGFDTLPLPV